jgi:hypothetical protein
VVSHKGINYEGNDPKLPGPGYYEPVLTQKKDRYTMRPRTATQRKNSNKYHFLVFVIDKNPGPGTYENCQSFKPDGTNHLSQFSKTCTPKIRLN